MQKEMKKHQNPREKPRKTDIKNIDFFEFERRVICWFIADVCECPEGLKKVWEAEAKTIFELSRNH